MHTQKSITIVSNRRKRTLSVNHILYIHMRRKHADVHMDNGEVIETRTTYKEFCDMLGDESRRFENPQEIHVDLSDKLYDVKKELLNSYHRS